MTRRERLRLLPRRLWCMATHPMEPVRVYRDFRGYGFWPAITLAWGIWRLMPEDYGVDESPPASP